MTDEKKLTMQERLDRVRDELAHIQQFDTNRPLEADQLTPRQRVAALIDKDSFLELGVFATSQHDDARAETPADGVITGYAEVEGRRIVVIAEDPIALARSDGQVGKRKRNRAISAAIYRRLPIVYLADGSPQEFAVYEPDTGIIPGGLVEQQPARDVSEREAPFVTVCFGVCRGQDAAVAVRSDLLVATERASFGPNASSSSTRVEDVLLASDAAAISAARQFLGGLPPRLGTLLEPLGAGPFDVAAPLAEDQMSADVAQLIAGLFDAGSPLELAGSVGCRCGLARIEGYPVAFALTGGSDPVALTRHDLRAIARVASWSAAFEIPFVSTQNTAGYASADAGTPDLLRAAASAVESLRATDSAKITIATGPGHILGDFALGGMGTGFDLIWAWPSGRVLSSEIRSYESDNRIDVPAEDPWKALEFGIVNDIIAPGETRAWIGRAIALLAPGRGYPAARYDRGQTPRDIT